MHLLQGVLAGEIFQYHQPLTQIFVFVLKLEDLRILIINELGLLLDGLSEPQIALQHLLHHVDCVNDSASDGILSLVGGVVAEAA